MFKCSSNILSTEIIPINIFYLQALNHTYFSISPLACALDDMPKPGDIQVNSREDNEKYENLYSEFEKLINAF